MGVLDCLLLFLIGTGAVAAICSMVRTGKKGGCAGCSGSCGKGSSCAMKKNRI